MKSFIQIGLDPKEKTQLEEAIKGQGFRSVASFAYFAMMQQLKKLNRNPFELSDEQTSDLLESIDEKTYSKVDLDNI